jgi:hypothetical protein
MSSCSFWAALFPIDSTLFRVDRIMCSMSGHDDRVLRIFGAGDSLVGSASRMAFRFLKKFLLGMRHVNRLADNGLLLWLIREHWLPH